MADRERPSTSRKFTDRHPAEPARHRPGFVERWRAAGDRPPLERWTSRGGMLVGFAITAALLVLAVRWFVLWYARTWSSM